MSKLDDLIKEYCPDGVEYKKLGEIGDFYSGLTGKSKDDFKDGNAIFISYKNVYNNPAVDLNTIERVKISNKEKQNALKYGDIIFTGSSETPDECAFSSVVTKKPLEKCYLNSFCFILRLHHTNLLLPDFSKHLFRSEKLRKQLIRTANGVTRFNVSKKLMKNVIIPVPPLPVQEEIVRILDEFTELTTELNSELRSEITARKKQYEYYRDELLNKSGIEEINEVSIGDCVSNTGNIKWNISEDNKNYQYIDLSSVDRGTCLITETSTINKASHPSRAQQIIKTNDVLFGTTRPMLKRLCIITEKYNNQICSTGFCVLRANNRIIPRFLYYVISSDKFYKYVENNQQGASYPSISNALIKNYRFKLPSLKTQDRLVKVLDNFDSICSDLNIGLPAEIEARQQQYEFYRDQLLTFAENGNTIVTDHGSRITDHGSRINLIKLLQYVFGYANVSLSDIAEYQKERIDASLLDASTYVGVDNLLQNKAGIKKSEYVPTEGRLTNYHKGDVLIGNIRPYLRKIWLAKNDGGTNGDVLDIAIKNNQIVTSKFLYYVLSSESFFEYDMQYAKGAKMPRGDKKAVMNYTFTIPTIKRQKEIVAILDKFDALCNDLSTGIPAEIEANQKRYEYYRDQLLTFDQKI